MVHCALAHGAWYRLQKMVYVRALLLDVSMRIVRDPQLLLSAFALVRLNELVDVAVVRV